MTNRGKAKRHRKRISLHDVTKFLGGLKASGAVEVPGASVQSWQDYLTEVLNLNKN